MWSNYQVLPPGARARLLDYEREGRRKGIHFARALVFDLTQNVPFAGVSSSGLMPALLRRSRPWGSRARRYLLPTEALQVQGVGPIYQHEHYGAEDVDKAINMPNLVRLPLYDEGLTHSFSDSELRSLAGNTMPLPMIGAALCFVLACTERV